MARRGGSNRKYITLLGVLFLAYTLFGCGRYDYDHSGIIKNTPVEDVWNFVADFNQMKRLNPTILGFKILSESGNIHDWHYTVEYVERLSHWPYWLNTAIGEYTVIKPMPTQIQKEHEHQTSIYSIQSKHSTCFFNELYCLHSESEFDFAPFGIDGKDTYCIEKVHYECPFIFGRRCRQEVIYQRQAILQNLQKFFESKQQSTK